MLIAFCQETCNFQWLQVQTLVWHWLHHKLVMIKKYVGKCLAVSFCLNVKILQVHACIIIILRMLQTVWILLKQSCTRPSKWRTAWLNVEILRPGSCSFLLCHFISMDMTDMQRSQRCQICDSLSIFLYHNVLQLYLVVYINVLDKYLCLGARVKATVIGNWFNCVYVYILLILCAVFPGQGLKEHYTNMEQLLLSTMTCCLSLDTSLFMILIVVCLYVICLPPVVFHLIFIPLKFNYLNLQLCR